MNLSERTFAGRGRFYIDSLKILNKEREFASVGSDIFSSEELTDRLYRFYLALMTKGWISNTKLSRIDDIGEAYLNGFYYPCVERPVLRGQVDLHNDFVPEYAGLVSTEGQDGVTFTALRKCNLPRGVASPTKGTTLMATLFFRESPTASEKKQFGPDGPMKLTTAPIVVCERTGRVLPCRRLGRQDTGDLASLNAAICGEAAATINAWADRRMLWSVETEEKVSKSFTTPFRLGVNEEYVKSLFYAREAPLTDTGRKRPILHWVQAHQRRVASGVDIDVRKHMRGIIEFEMDGFPFRITSPVKGYVATASSSGS